MRLSERLEDRDVREAVEEAIANWAGRYNEEYLARVKGDDGDAEAIALRGQLASLVISAIQDAIAD